MAPSNLQHRRTHNLLLISKLLNQRDTASPFTLILDSLEQSSIPLLAEYVRRAKAARVQVIYVSFETLKIVRKADIFVSAWSQTAREWQDEVTRHLKNEATQRKLLIIDTLNTLATASTSTGTEAPNLPNLLSTFISPTTSLLGIYHTDIPTPLPSSQTNGNPYSPPPLTLLRYLATTILRTHSLHHALARKAARERSHIEPSFGLEEGVEGVVQGLGSNGTEGVVLELEHRRKSGRGVREWYFLPLRSSTDSTATGKAREMVTLLEDHPQYAKVDEATGGASGEAESTFELGLTEKQRLDREGVVLPYFDAQKGGGEGGRILYDMGSEDDFDEEEDEI